MLVSGRALTITFNFFLRKPQLDFSSHLFTQQLFSELPCCAELGGHWGTVGHLDVARHPGSGEATGNFRCKNTLQGTITWPTWRKIIDFKHILGGDILVPSGGYALEKGKWSSYFESIWKWDEKYTKETVISTMWTRLELTFQQK